jgi:protein-S-isoprenylcysteine O-methyltransferase Ste14
MVLLKTLIFTVVVPGTVTVLVPWLLLSSGREPVALDLAWVQLAGSSVIALGVVIYLCCAWDFAVKGRGTPAPIDPPKALVASRLYRVVRNPMYLGVMSILVGEAVTFESVRLAVYAAAMWSFFHLVVVFYEEPCLRGRFGESYREYCRAVPRWVPNSLGGGGSR